jgi:hypothetical protein
MRINTHCLAATAVLALALPASAQYSTPMRDVENPAHSPLRIAGTATVPSGFVGSFGSTVGSALAGDRRFVIEYVSFECSTSGAIQPVRVWLSTAEKTSAVSWTFHSYPIALNRTTADYTGFVSANGKESLRLYHDGGQAVQVGITLSGAAPAGGIQCRVEVSGYTTSMP